MVIDTARVARLEDPIPYKRRNPDQSPAMPGSDIVQKQSVLGGIAGIALLAFALSYRFYPNTHDGAAQGPASGGTTDGKGRFGANGAGAVARRGGRPCNGV